MVTIKR